MTPPRHTGAGKIAAAPRAPRPTGILPIHACMINSDNEISDSEIISTGIPYSVPVYRYDELTAQIHSPVGRHGQRAVGVDETAAVPRLCGSYFSAWY